MRKFLLLIVIAAAVIIGWSAQAMSAEYYVTESRSGIIAITDHKPQSGASILRGPFETQEAAEEALTPEEKEKLGTRGTGKGQCKGQGRNR